MTGGGKIGRGIDCRRRGGLGDGDLAFRREGIAPARRAMTSEPRSPAMTSERATAPNRSPNARRRSVSLQSSSRDFGGVKNEDRLNLSFRVSH
ncbi:unnamed protein product [Linum trigynum]|uniref:Uncharacterized protein n=1 Tax=Linum trigynum TaxID=586398 RepID=A0AAV2G1K5_9ROSI